MTSSYVPRGVVRTEAADYNREQSTQEALATAEEVSSEGIRRKQLQAEQVNQELEAQTAAAEQQAQGQAIQAAQEKPPEGPIGAVAEVGTAIAGGAVNAVESIGETSEKILTGKMMDPGFKPTWLQVADEKEPMTRTVWGGLLKGITEYGILALLTRKAAKSAVAVRLPGATQLSQALSADNATSKKGKVVRTLTKGAIVGSAADFIGSYSEGENLSNEMKKLMPWMPTPLAIDEDDSPLERRVKNYVESVGLGLTGELAFSWLRAKHLSKNAPVPKEQDLAKYRQLERDNAKVERLMAQKAIIHKTGMNADELTAQYGKDWDKTLGKDLKLSSQDIEVLRTDPAYQGAEELSKQLRKDYNDLHKKLDPKTALEAKMKKDADARQKNHNEKVQEDLAADPDGLNPSAFVNGPLFDRPDKALFTPAVGKGKYFQNLRAAMIMQMDPTQQYGRRPAPYTESGLNRLTGGDDLRRKEIEEISKKIEIELSEMAVAEGLPGGTTGFSVKQIKELAAARYLDLLDDVVTDVDDLEPLRKSLSEGAVDPRDRTNVMTGKQERYLGLVDYKATEMLISTTAAEIADLATGAASINGVMDNSRQLDGLLNRMQFMLKEVGKAKYISGFDLAGLKGNAGEMTSRINQIDNDVDTYIRDLRKLFDEDPQMLQGYLDALKLTDGMPKAFDEMYKFAKRKFAVGLEQLVDPNAKSELLKQLQAVAVNSVLSGPRTVARAFMGNTMMVYMRPMQAALGGLISGDAKGTAMGLAGMKTVLQATGEAWKVAGMSLRQNVGNASPSALLDRAPDDRFIIISEDWKNLGRIIEAGPEVAPKIAYRVTDMLYSFNRWIGSNYPQVAMTALDDMTGVVMGRMDAKMNAFSKAWDETGGKDMKELVRKYEKEFYDQVFTSDDAGPMLLSGYAKRISQEASLRLPMPGHLKRMEDTFNNTPGLKPFFLFMKTGYNALDVIRKHTPILARFNDEYRTIMSATPDNLDSVRAYGIDTPAQLMESQMVMKGRIATGYLSVTAAVGLYLSGGLTGNGPFDRQERNLWMQTGWQPRSIKIPGTEQYISYESMEPFTSFLAMVADIGDNSNNLGEPATQNLYAKLAFGIANNVTNKSFLQGFIELSDLISGLQGSPDRSATFLANLANNQLPWAGARRAIANLLDPGMRELDNDFQSILKTAANANPVFKGQLPIKYDILDGSIVRNADPLTRIYNFFSPVSLNFKDSPTRRTLRETGYDIARKFSRDSRQNKLDPEKRSRMQALIGSQNLEGQLTALFAKPEIRKEMDTYYKMRRAGIRSKSGKGADEQYGLDVKDTKFYNAIDSLFTQAQKRAEAELYKEYPSLRRLAVQRNAIEIQQKEGRPGAALNRILNYSEQNQ